MKRILLVLNPRKINNLAVDFGCYLGKLTKSKVTGVFLEENHSAVLPAAPLVHELEAEVYHADNPYDFKQVVARFQEACICRDTAYTSGGKHNIVFNELIEESRFADFLVLDPEISFGQQIGATPSPLAKQILLHAKCPVVLAPELFDGIKTIIMAYDGSETAIHAIKQFTYLFPEFCDCRVQLVQVENGHKLFPGDQLFTEWINCHYPHLEYIVLNGNPVDRLTNHLLSHDNAFVIMGAYGRSFISRLFRKSMADNISDTIVNSIFIAH